MAADLLGSWVQDNYAAGARKTYTFTSQGSYVHQSAIGGRIAVDERGTFSAAGDTLALSPAGGGGRSVKYRLDKDPYVGDERLVLDNSDIYYRP